MKYSLMKNSLSVVLIALVMQGCAVTETAINPVPKQMPVSEPAVAPVDRKMVLLGKKTKSPMDLIAADFLQALEQAPGFASSNARISTQRYKTGFETALTRRLEQKGYELTEGDTNGGNYPQLRTTTTASKTDASVVTFSVQLGGVAMKRTYLVNQSYVRPLSGLKVRGVAPELIVLDDRKFVEQSLM